MFRIQSLYFVIALFWVHSTKCDSDCEFSNVDLKAVAAGIDGKVSSSDPLHQHLIESHLSETTYTLKNLTLNGFKDCEAIHVKCDKGNQDDFSFQYHIKCSRIILTNSFEAKGNLSELLIEGTGNEITDLQEYVFEFKGKYEVFVGKDEKPRPIIKEYSFETNPKGIVKFTLNYVNPEDKERDERINKFINDNWKTFEKIIKTPVLDTFIETFIVNFNAYIRSQ